MYQAIKVQELQLLLLGLGVSDELVVPFPQRFDPFGGDGHIL